MLLQYQTESFFDLPKMMETEIFDNIYENYVNTSCKVKLSVHQLRSESTKYI